MKKAVPPVPSDTPVLPPFESTPYDVKINLNDGSTETIKVMGRGPVAAYMTALYTAQRWPRDRIAMIVSINH